MGNKNSSRKHEVVHSKQSPPELNANKLNIVESPQLLRVKEKCKQLATKKNVTTGTKIALIKEAIPGLKILYEPLKTYYSLDKVVMPGKFGAISKAYCKQDLDTEVLVKVINLENVTSHLYLIIQDLVIFGKSDHPNICKIKNILCDNNKLYLVMDYVEMLSLSDYVIDQGKLEEKDAVTIIFQLLDVLDHLNSLCFCHRDFKPENILINPDSLNIKLLNFEFSTIYDEFKKMKTKLGNQYYTAPEVLTRNYDRKCDIWSIGCIAYFLQTGFPPFLADSPKEVSELIQASKLNFLDEDWEGRSPESLAFIRKALTNDPKYRLSLENALDHPWITQDCEKMVNGNPQDLDEGLDTKSFDIFIRELFAILLENFDLGMLKSLRETMKSESREVTQKILIKDVTNIVENTQMYSDELRKLMLTGLKQFEISIDCLEFLESVIEEKEYLCSYKIDDDMISEIGHDTNTNYAFQPS